MTAESSTKFRPDIEGLRGLAVLMIVAFHAGIPGFRGGYTGVDVFFVLSGFLITGLLLKGIPPADFYARRARRILPALMTMLVITMGASMILLPPLEQKDVAQAALSTAGFSSNVYFQHQAADYFKPEADSNPLLHTWSLGVEEQFYLAWPLLIWLAMRGGRSRAGARTAVAILFALSLGACFWLAAKHPPWAFYSSPARAWEFAAGALICFLPQRPQAAWLNCAGLLAILAAGVFPFMSGANPGISAIIPVLGTAAVLVSRSSLLSAPLMRSAGRLSYSWYLWHWPVTVLVGERLGRLPVWAGIACAAAALGFASLTYRLVENPLRFHPRLINRRALSLSLAAAAGIAGIVLAVAWRQVTVSSAQYKTYAAPMSDVPQFNCRAEFLDPEVHECSYDDLQSGRTLVLFGDSHAAQWFPPLEQVANKRGLRLTTFIKMACPAAEVPAFQSKIGREEAQCVAWREAALARIAQIKPAAAVVATSVEYVNANGSALNYQQWHDGARQTFSRLDAAGVPTLLLRDTPRAKFNVPTCLARAAWRGTGECVIVRSQSLDEAAYRAELDAASGFQHVGVADLSDGICDSQQCPAVRNGRIVFRDRDHLTASFAATFEPVLDRLLDRYLR